jgi:hypothetical protein
MAVRWKSRVPGVAPPLWSELYSAWELGEGCGNIDPPPPGVNPVRREDSFGVGKLPEKW